MKYNTTCVILPKARNSTSLVFGNLNFLFPIITPTLPSIIVINHSLAFINNFTTQVYNTKYYKLNTISTIVKFSQFWTGIIYYIFSWVFCFLNIVLKIHLFACSCTMLILCCIIFHCMNIIQVFFFFLPSLLLMDFYCTNTRLLWTFL